MMLGQSAPILYRSSATPSSSISTTCESQPKVRTNSRPLEGRVVPLVFTLSRTTNRACATVFTFSIAGSWSGRQIKSVGGLNLTAPKSIVPDNNVAREWNHHG